MLGKAKISKKRLILYVIIIITMIIGNIYIFQRNSGSRLNDLDFTAMNMPAAQDTLMDMPLPAADQPAKKKIDSPLAHELFTALEKIGDWPIIPKNVGKADPFAPLPELIKED